MAFVVEDGTGLSNATAYVTVQFVDDYHAELFNEGWSGSAEEKQAAILQATRYIDLTYSFLGFVVLKTQALSWPRSGIWTEDLIEVPDDVVPSQVQNATAELARLVRKDCIDLIAIAAFTGVQRRRERQGEVELEFEYGDAASEGDRAGEGPPTSFPIVDAMLVDLYRGKRRGPGNVPIVRG